MKKGNLLILGFAGMFLFSCSVNTDNFQARKYTKFKRSHGDIPVEKTLEAKAESGEEQPAEQYLAAAENINEPASGHRPGQKSVLAAKKHAVPSRYKLNDKTSPVSSFETPRHVIRNADRMKLNMPAEKKSTSPGLMADVIAIILAILLPPLGVWYHEQKIGTNFWIALILTLIFWIPGVIFALLVVLGAI